MKAPGRAWAVPPARGVTSRPMSTGITRGVRIDAEAILLVGGILAIVLGFFMASQVLIVYSMEVFLYTGLYIALQVGGWLAVLTWYVLR